MSEYELIIAAGAFLLGALVTAVLMATQRARLRAERDAAVARAEAHVQDRQQLRDAFQSLGVDALRQNGELFLQVARAELDRSTTHAQVSLAERERAIALLVEPIREGISRYDDKVSELERERARHMGQLTQRLHDVVQSNEKLRDETQHLAQALRTPAVRGAWGEMQLRRVCELAGMLEHCDFVTQETVEDEERRQRPDLVVRLPERRTIVVDAKAPLGAYLDAIGEPDEGKRSALFRTHARHVRAHIAALARKQYWQQFERSPEFVVLFLPGEAFFSAALQADPSLIEAGLAEGVVLATPTTLIALLKSVAYGWRQDAMADNAAEISALGRELYERMAVLATHVMGVGDGLRRATDAYNSAVSTMERRVLASARRFKDLGAASPHTELPTLDPVVGPSRTADRDDPARSMPPADGFRSNPSA
ncbi:MAG: DNA recombination protein RmuC [Gemmatimonadaceae bacterium]